MNKLFTLLGVIALYLGVARQAEAHAVWIEANPKATKNKQHEVKIFYGEYESGEVDATEKWYSDLKNLEVWLVSPNKAKTKLTVTEGSDHLKATFTPTEDGVYYITTAHATKDLGGTTKYEFASVATVLVGNAGSAAMAAPSPTLSVVSSPKAYKTNAPVELQVLKNGTALSEGKVSIMSPEGWVKTVKTDKQGKVSFKPLLKGSYVIEASDYKKEEGEWNEKKYTHSWIGSTTRILVN